MLSGREKSFQTGQQQEDMLHFRIQRTKDMANQGTIRTSLGQQNWGWRCRKQRNKVKRTPPEQKKNRPSV